MATKNPNARNKLTPRQQLFVKEYQIDLNAYQAALRAGYAANTALTESAKWVPPPTVENPRDLSPVQFALYTDIQKRLKKLDITCERVLKEYAKLGFSDISSVAKWDGSNVTLASSEQLEPDITAAIAEVKKTEDGVQIKLHDKKGALDSIARHLGMFNKGADGQDLVETMRHVVICLPPNGREKITDASDN